MSRPRKQDRNPGKTRRPYQAPRVVELAVAATEVAGKVQRAVETNNGQAFARALS